MHYQGYAKASTQRVLCEFLRVPAKNGEVNTPLPIKLVTNKRPRMIDRVYHSLLN